MPFYDFCYYNASYKSSILEEVKKHYSGNSGIQYKTGMTDRKIKISAVRYANTYPFIYGLAETGFDKKVIVTTDHPADCAAKLISGEVDIGLIPVAVLPFLPEYYIISDFCLGQSCYLVIAHLTKLTGSILITAQDHQLCWHVSWLKITGRGLLNGKIPLKISIF
jgi:hypothetical protein